MNSWTFAATWYGHLAMRGVAAGDPSDAYHFARLAAHFAARVHLTEQDFPDGDERDGKP